MKRIPQRVLKTRTLWKLSKEDVFLLRLALKFYLDNHPGTARFWNMYVQLCEEIEPEKLSASAPPDSSRTGS